MIKPKDAPKIIYLQVDPEGESAIDWFDGVTWCTDKINESDIKYISFDFVRTIYPAILKSFEEQPHNKNLKCNCHPHDLIYYGCRCGGTR